MIFLEIDPNVVKPGWTPLIITILLAAAIALLMISMRRQMKKVRLPGRDDLGGDAATPDQAADESTTEDSADQPAYTAADQAESDRSDGRQTTGNAGRSTDS